MAQLSRADILAKINNWIKANGNGEITGPQLNEVLRDLLDSKFNLLDDAGAGIVDKHYTHNQDAALATWTVEHNLAKRPSVHVVDSGGNIVFGNVEYLDDDTLKIYFTAAFSGKAYCN